MHADQARVAALRDDLEAMLAERLPDLVVNGAREARLAGNLHVSVSGVPNQAVVARVRHRLAIATGAACSSGIEAPSHVLRAMGLPRAHQEGALRIGLGKYTTREEIEAAAEWLHDAVRAVRDTAV